MARSSSLSLCLSGSRPFHSVLENPGQASVSAVSSAAETAKSEAKSWQQEAERLGRQLKTKAKDAERLSKARQTAAVATERMETALSSCMGCLVCPLFLGPSCRCVLSLQLLKTAQEEVVTARSQWESERAALVRQSTRSSTTLVSHTSHRSLDLTRRVCRPC